MAHIVIIGASTGGLPAAYDIKAKLGNKHEVTVINVSPTYSFIPSNPWVAVGWRNRSQVTFEIEPCLKKKGINFIAATVTTIEPDKNTLTLNDGQSIEYNYLIIATGPKLAFDEVDGLGPDGHTQSICTLGHAEAAYEQWQDFIQSPGPIVVGAAQGASCFGPAYEFAMIMDTALRRARIRDQVPITFVTSEPYIGHLGLGGVGDSKGLLESEMRQRHISFITNAKISKAEAGKLHIVEHNRRGEETEHHELPFAYSMILPAFKGVDAVNAVGADLVNPRGFIKVDQYQRNPKWQNIYGVGVCIAIPPVEATPIPTGTPKTGYMIESMVTASVNNIWHDLKDSQPEAVATWNAFCLADMGDVGAAFIALPQIPPRNVTWARRGRWVHWAKVLFEKYFIRNMKKGTTEPLYQKYALRLMGIDRLKPGK